MNQNELQNRVLLNCVEHHASVVMQDVYQDGYSAEDILGFSKEKWEQYFSKIKVNRILQTLSSIRIESVMDELLAQKIGILPFEDLDYPPLLREIYNPPRLLYYIGKLPQPSSLLISVVGSRDSTMAGRLNARDLGQFLADRGIGVVSGLARGIDYAAHEGVLKQKGTCIGVVACGIHEFTRPRLQPFHSAILENGCILSEFPPDYPVYRKSFPIRNRIITGMSVATILVEAALRSGSMVSARLALEQGREVFAFPGPIFSETYSGCHELIRNGASLVSSFEDIVNDLSLNLPQFQAVATQTIVPGGDDGKRVFALIGKEPQSVEEIVYQLQMPLGRILGVILELERNNLLTRLPGDMLIRRS